MSNTNIALLVASPFRAPRLRRLGARLIRARLEFNCAIFAWPGRFSA